MNYFPQNKPEKYKIEICFINLIIFFYLFRTAIPFFKFPFLILYVVFSCYVIISYNKKILSTVLEFLRCYSLPIILAIILIASFLFSVKIYLTIFKDVINLIILLTLFLISTLIIPGKKELKFFVLNQANLLVLFGSVIAIVGLLDLFNILPSNEYSTLKEIRDISSDTIAYVDNNFALLPVIFGILVIFIYQLNKNSSRFQIVINNLLLFLFSCQIILSGSRRGLVLFILIFLITIYAKIYSLRSKNGFLNQIGSGSDYFLLSTVFFIIVLHFFLFHASRSFQNKILEGMGTHNALVAKYDISKNVYRYISAVDKKVSFSQILWDTSFDSYDPNSGWGYRIHKTEYPLHGMNVEIVPKGAKGYLMDSTCNTAYYPSTNVAESYTLAVSLKTSPGDHYKASVYCYLSDSFNVDAVSLTVKFSCINDGIVSGNTTAFYDLDRKNMWQKLEIEFYCNKGEVPVLMSFWKKGIRDFSKQKGYVIFAYPEYEKLRDYKTSFINNTTQKDQNKFIQRPPLSLNGGVETITHNSVITMTKFQRQKYYSMGILQLSVPALIQQEMNNHDSDPIRSVASKFISEDTTYYPFKSDIVLKSGNNPFVDERILRWKFALKIYAFEYNWKQKLFGSGFKFLNWFGYYFDRDKTISDYPHNPFLSVLLYSGVLGLLIYCYFIYKVFFYYIRYRKEYPLLFIFFLITFFFTFFSGGSPFDPPIMGFFVILPFFIHSVHKKDSEVSILSDQSNG